MIKKMLAMLVAISCAFGAWADTHISGTDFSGLTADEPFYTQRDDSGADSGTSFWYSGDTSDFEGKIVTDGVANYLDFESNITNPLYRTINDSYGLAPSSFQATPIGTGLFIDTHVQFTPYLVNENHPEPTKVTNDDKLIVWVRETEVDGDANITNLIITAGYIAGNGNVSASNYVATLSSAEVSALCTNQCRLTIKSYQNITAYSGVTVMGFVVYINETVVEYIGDAFADGSVFLPLVPGPAQYYSQGGGHNKLLPCLMDYGTDPSAIDSYSKLTAVGYAGMGKIGDVIFDSYNTTYPAFAGDDLAFQVVLGDGVTSFDYLGDTYETNASFTVDATATSVTISNVLYDTTAGYTHKTGTWHNNVAVDNQVGAGGDYGTFYFANGTILTLVGFQANYIVNGTEYDNLTDALEAALDGGYTLVLNNDVEITEGDGSLMVGENETLVLDLKGHTIKGTGTDPTIVNAQGSLTIIDTSANHDGKVLNSDDASACLVSYANSVTELEAGIYEDIADYDSDTDTITINGGTYKDQNYDDTDPAYEFYLIDCLASGKEVIDWIQDGDDYYAVIGEPSGDRWDITFSTNNVIVTEWNLTVDDGDPIGNHIPNFTGGSWDAPAPTAETIVTSDTNFNYTIVPSYTLTYATEYGAVPDGVVYTASTPDFALAAAPVTEVVGIEFAGWVIGVTTNNAGATYVVADHLENTTATAAWAPVVPTGTAIYLVMGSGVDSISTSFNGTDWTAYSAPLEDVELGSTLYIKGTSSVTGYDVPQFSIVVDDTHATEQTALVVNKSAIVYFPQSSIEQQWADRDGTAAKPFVIRNYADLVALKNGVANGTVTNQCFEQVADIDMDGEEPWAGIGTFECRTAGSGAFEGTYDGGNYAISNVTFDQHEYNGIFAAVVGGVIKNLTVDVDGFAATSAFGGAAIAGVAKNCFLTNLVATGTIIGQSSTPCTHSAAGIAVRMEGTVAYACTNRCEIWSGKGKLGGIAAMGQGDRADSLILCSNEGDIHGTKTGGLGDGGVGGIFGYQGYGDGYQAVTYTNCRNIGQVTSLSSDKTGSILGHHSNSGPSFEGTIITLDNMLVSGYSEGSDGVTYGKSIGGGLVELCTQAEFETNNTYSTLYSGLTPTFEFSAPGTISFNTNLFAATAFAITATGDLDVDSTEAGGIVTFTASVPTPTDPWAPSAETDEAAAAKAAELFPGTEVAANVTTYAMYTNLVDYIKGVTSQSEVPGDITDAQAPWLWKSYILGANPLFVTNAVVTITDVNAAATAGEWDFIVKVTEGELTTAHSVAAAKVAALVKVTDSLSPASWSAPDPEDVHADLAPLLGTNLIKVTVDFGTDTSGFMKVSE